MPVCCFFHLTLRFSFLNEINILEDNNKEQIDVRGVFGETVLHVACLFKNFELAKHIAATYDFSAKTDENDGALVNAIFTKEQYRGETSLHIAIVHGSLDMVQFLLKEPVPGDRSTPKQKVDPNIECNGVFFDRKKGKMYMGGFPLSFAACLGNRDIVDALLVAGARFSNRDMNGNTVLHLMVLKGQADMYDYLFEKCQLMKPREQHNPDKPSDELTAEVLELITNNANLTPLKLCAKKAKIQLFEHILKKRRTLLWTYGPWEASIFPLEELDTGRKSARCCGAVLCCATPFHRPPPGALEVAVYTTPSFVVKPGVSLILFFIQF